NPNFLGTFLAVGAVLLTVLAWRRPPRLFHVLGAALVLAAMGTTGSRGALVVYGAGLLSAAFWLQARTKAVLAATMVVPIIFVGVGALTSARIQGSAAQGIDSATIEASPALRFQALQLALTLARQQPVSGVGYGRFPEYAAASDHLGVPFNTHNDYLRVWAESGLPSLLLLVGLFTMCLRRGSIYARADRSGLGAAAFAATSAYAVSLVTLNGLASAQYSVLWALLAGMLLGAPSPTHAPYPPTKE
ncbi:MAG: O-antigen ligase family protein, partial [Actinomycetota bacterium]|nr:O-antigen ligase family protein [Actinomycetota bacterium]